jgi:hypothetical protein
VTYRAYIEITNQKRYVSNNLRRHMQVYRNTLIIYRETGTILMGCIDHYLLPRVEWIKGFAYPIRAVVHVALV